MKYEGSRQVEFLLHLLNISLEGDSFLDVPVPDANDLEGFVSLVIRQELVVPVYAAVSKCLSKGVRSESLHTLREVLRKRFYLDLMKATEQDERIDQVIRALDEAGVDSMPLKGRVMRGIYPLRAMRSMCDFDILVRSFDKEKIDSAMKGIGYSADSFTGGKHEHYKGRSGPIVEVHRRLTEKAGHAEEWERKVWQRAKREDGSRFVYAMSPEDIYLFHLLHMEQDITHGALPMRAVCDLYRFALSFPDPDEAYIEEELRRLDITGFARQMERFTAVCFKGAAMNEDAALLLDYYMREHMLGSPKRNALSRAALSDDKSPALGLFKARVRSVFVPMSFMKEQFPELKKFPLLLPICQVKRLVRMMRRYRADSYRRNYDRLTGDELEEMRDVLKAAGITKDRKLHERDH